MSTVILPLEHRNIPAVAEIESECFSNPWSENTLNSELDNPRNIFFGAFEGETLCGYIGGQSVCGESGIFNVAVSKQYRRKGIGRLLVEAFIAKAKEIGSEVIYLEVRPTNLNAIALYEKIGFVFCGIRRDYYTNPKENAILMRLAFDGTQEYEEDL